MSFSVLNNQDLTVQKIAHPWGANLTNNSTRTLAPTPGQTAYDLTTNKLYLGDNTNTWQPFNTGGTGILNLQLGAIGSTPNANGASIVNTTGLSILTLQPANNTFGGVMTTAAQGFAGVKDFNDGIILGGYSTVLSDYSINTVAMNWTGAVSTQVQNVVFERIGHQCFVKLPKVFNDKAILSGGTASIDISGTVPPQYIPAIDQYASIGVFSAIYTNAATNQEYSPGIFKMQNNGMMRIGTDIMTTDNTFVLFGSGGSGTYNGVQEQVVQYTVS